MDMPQPLLVAKITRQGDLPQKELNTGPKLKWPNQFLDVNEDLPPNPGFGA